MLSAVRDREASTARERQHQQQPAPPPAAADQQGQQKAQTQAPGGSDASNKQSQRAPEKTGDSDASKKQAQPPPEKAGDCGASKKDGHAAPEKEPTNKPPPQQRDNSSVPVEGDSTALSEPAMAPHRRTVVTFTAFSERLCEADADAVCQAFEEALRREFSSAADPAPKSTGQSDDASAPKDDVVDRQEAPAAKEGTEREEEETPRHVATFTTSTQPSPATLLLFPPIPATHVGVLSSSMTVATATAPGPQKAPQPEFAGDDDQATAPGPAPVVRHVDKNGMSTDANGVQVKLPPVNWSKPHTYDVAADPVARYVPDRAAIDLSCEPIFPSQPLYRAVRSCWWPAFLVGFAAVGLILNIIAVDFEDSTARHAGYIIGFLLLLFPLLLHTVAYYQRVVTHIASSFEFWYLSVQIIIFSACETVKVMERLHPAAAITPRVVLTGVAMTGLLCIDGSAVSRIKKGLVMLVATILFVVLGVSWRIQSQEVADRVVEVAGVSTTVGALATSSYVTLAIFCGKFAAQALCLGKEVVLINFSWQDDQTLKRRPFRLLQELPETEAVVRAGDDTTEKKNQ